MRTDIFTRKHKSLRARLFETSDAIGRADWTSDDEVKQILTRLDALDADLRAHGEHEDAYFMPLLKRGAPDLFEAMEEDHEADVARRASLLKHAHAAATAAPEARAQAGLTFYLAFNRYVAEYLHHINAEETLVMPMLWATQPEEALAEAMGRFMREVLPSKGPDEVAHIIAHIPPADRAEMLRAVRAKAPPAAFTGLLALVHSQLTQAERERLDRDLAT